MPKIQEGKFITVAICVGIEVNEDYRKRFNQVYEVRKPEDLPDALFDVFVRNALLQPT
jgi:hypothetical protein